MRDGTQRPTSAVGDETRLLALFFDLCRLTQRAHKTSLTRARYAPLIDLYSAVPGGWIYSGPWSRPGPGTQQRGVPGECIWSLIFHRRTHDAAVKQSEGQSCPPYSAPGSCYPSGRRLRQGRRGDLPSSAHARNISITTCLDAYLLTATRKITTLTLTLLHLLILAATFAK